MIKVQHFRSLKLGHIEIHYSPSQYIKRESQNNKDVKRSHD